MGRARVEVPLFTGGRVTAGIESATQAARGAGLAQESYEQDLRLQVATAYVDVLRARRALRAAESAVASLTAHANDVAVMVEREAVARNDLLAARVTLADAEQVRLRAENRHAMALAAYNRLLGEPMDRVPELAELPADMAAAPLPAASVDELVERARASRRELAGLEARSLALAEQARSENASRWPQVGLHGRLPAPGEPGAGRRGLRPAGRRVLLDALRRRPHQGARERAAAARAAPPPRTGTICSPAWRWKSGRRGSTCARRRPGCR